MEVAITRRHEKAFIIILIVSAYHLKVLPSDTEQRLGLQGANRWSEQDIMANILHRSVFHFWIFSNCHWTLSSAIWILETRHWNISWVILILTTRHWILS
jgi:hypothetical protein